MSTPLQPATPDSPSNATWALWEDLASRVGTPAYVHDADALRERVAALFDVFPKAGESRLLYSFKANPLPSLAGELRAAGCEADLTSLGEIEAAIAAGFDLSKALYGGPGKSEAEYDAAILAGLAQFSVESAEDLARLSTVAAERGVRVRALIRLNPHSPPHAKLAMAGVASQFGFEEDALRRGDHDLRSLAGDAVVLSGFHLYWGTQIADAESILASFAKTIEIVEDLAPALGVSLDILNFGGGFPWPYAHRGEGPDLAPLREGLAELAGRGGPASGARWWFESGRYLTASSGTLLARVMEIKRSKDERDFLILDTGIHHLGGMAGLGRIPRFSVDLIVPPARRGNETLTVDLVGPLCTPLDCIGKRIELPRVEPGDLVAIPNVGAYGPTASVAGFLSRPAPFEILHRDGKVLAIHRLRSGHEVLS